MHGIIETRQFRFTLFSLLRKVAKYENATRTPSLEDSQSIPFQ